MKKLIYLYLPILVALLLISPVVGCKQEAAHTPVPQTPVPSPPTTPPTEPIPEPTPELPAEPTTEPTPEIPTLPPPPSPLPPPLAPLEGPPRLTGPETLTYTNADCGFSFEYSRGWYFEDLSTKTGPPEARPIVTFGCIPAPGCWPGIGVTLVELPESPKVTLEDYYTHCMFFLRKQMENEKPVREDDTIIGGLPAKTLTYISRGNGDTFMFSWAFFLKENTAYLITYLNKSECHDECIDCFDKVIGSFRFE